MTARRHHYVWRRYLLPWTTQKKKSSQVWCLQRGKKSPIFVDVKNVAVERDFYRLIELRPGDLEFVRAIGLPDRMHPLLRELNEDLIRHFEHYFQLQSFGRNHPKAQPALIDALNRELIEFEERSYASMESDTCAQLGSLVAGDVSFFDDDAQATRFCHFLMHQHFRTKRTRDSLRQTVPSEEARAQFDRTWPILRHIFSTNVAASIFRDRKRTCLQVVRAEPGSEFITSDQPVVNTHAAFLDPTSPVHELEIYYPVSPVRSVLFLVTGYMREDTARK